MKNNTNRMNSLRKSNTESRQLTREYIQTALFYLLNEQPFEKITVTDIIRRSGISRSGFYRNYPSKEAVLEDIINQTFDKMKIFVTDNQSINDTHQKCLHIFNEIRQNAATFKILLRANVPHEYILKTEAFLEELVSYETSGDYYRTIAVFAALKEVAIVWFENGMKESPEEMADFFSSLFQS